MPVDPRVRLRWYEHWLLLFLARSPRIARIVVRQTNPAGPDEPPEDVDDARHERSLRDQLEALYHSPSAEDVREG